jgi:hypothetical protein
MDNGYLILLVVFLCFGLATCLSVFIPALKKTRRRLQAAQVRLRSFETGHRSSDETTPAAPGPKKPQGLCYYFAYGSNMNPERMLKRQVSFTKRVAGSLRNWKLVFNVPDCKQDGVAYANIERCEGARVEGVLYEVEQAGMSILDRFETGYARLLVSVFNDGHVREAYVYIFPQADTESNRKPARWYLAHLLAGQDLLSPDYGAELAQTDTAHHAGAEN